MRSREIAVQLRSAIRLPFQADDLPRTDFYAAVGHDCPPMIETMVTRTGRSRRAYEWNDPRLSAGILYSTLEINETLLPAGPDRRLKLQLSNKGIVSTAYFDYR